MNPEDYAKIVEHYQHLADDELLRLSDARSQLDPEALPALDSEVARRKVQLDALRRDQVAARASHADWLKSEHTPTARIEAWRTRMLRWMMIVVVPLLPIMFISEIRSPNGITGSFVAFVVVVGVYWALVIVTRLRARRPKTVQRHA
jgi:hypothetical protein